MLNQTPYAERRIRWCGWTGGRLVASLSYPIVVAFVCENGQSVGGVYKELENVRGIREF